MTAGAPQGALIIEFDVAFSPAAVEYPPLPRDCPAAIFQGANHFSISAISLMISCATCGTMALPSALSRVTRRAEMD